MPVIATLPLYRPAAGGDFLTTNAASSVSDLEFVGTPANGQPLVIKTNGQFNFGTKPQQTPYIYDRFNGTDGQLLDAYNPLWVKYGGGVNGAVISSANQRYVGSKSAYNDSSRDGFDTNHWSFPNTKKLRWSYWVYAELGAPGSSGQIKLGRVNSSEASQNGVYNGTGTFFVTSWHPNTDDTSLVTFNSGPGDPGVGSGLFGTNYLTMRRNQWFKVDCWADHSTPGVADGSYFVSVNNGQYTRGNFGGAMTRDAGLTHLANSTILGTMLANQDPSFPMKIQISDKMLEAGWNRVVVANSKTIVPGVSIVEDQNYSAWNAGEISLPSLNFGAIPSGHHKYLKIYNDSNVEIVNVRIA